MFTVDDKPLPTDELAPNSKYPTAALLVGQSFYVPYRTKYWSCNSICRKYQRQHVGVKFALRTEGEGFRVYRVA